MTDKYKYKIRSEDEYIDDSIEDILDQVVFQKSQIEFLLWRVETLHKYRVKLAERRKEEEAEE